MRFYKHTRAKVAALAGAGLGMVVTATALAAQRTPLPGAVEKREGGTGILGAALAYLDAQPFVLLFAVVALGYMLAKVKVKGISLGATGSTLVISLIISLWANGRYGVQFAIPDLASALFFNLFMFSVGMKVGPQFLSGLRRGVWGFVLLAVFVPFASLGLMLALRAIFDLAPGLTAGIFAGANTATPGLGSARSAYLGMATGQEEALGNLSTSFAFAYCISLTLFVVMMKVMPRLFGRDVVRDARDFEAAIAGSGTEPLPGATLGFIRGTVPARVRTYVLEHGPLIGQSLGALRTAHPRVAVERLQRGDEVIEARDDVVLQRGDVIALFSRIEWLLLAAKEIGPEVDAPSIRDVGAETVEVMVQRAAAAGRKLIDVARDVGHGLFLNALFRGGEQIPFGPETVFQKGDVLRVTGSLTRIAMLERNIGRVVRQSMTTDIVTLALGLTLGALIGSLSVTVVGVKLTLGSAVGLLLIGIVLSTLRTRNPALGGPFPEPARSLLEDLGLNVFVAVLGLNSGAGVLAAIGAGALTPILIGCVVVGFLPAIAAWVFGQYVLKMNSALLLGAAAGARCNSAGLRAGQEATHSNVPAISYPVTFAISNVLLTLMAYGLALFDQ